SGDTRLERRTGYAKDTGVSPSPWLAITAVLASSILIPVAARAEAHAAFSGAPGIAAGPAPHCEEGISSARRGSGAAPSGPAAPAPVGTDSSAPAGMVWIPGGEFAMGSDQFPDARPVHRVAVDGFWMDVTEVTNAEFDAFVRATSCVAGAELSPPGGGDLAAAR